MFCSLRASSPRPPFLAFRQRTLRRRSTLGPAHATARATDSPCVQPGALHCAPKRDDRHRGSHSGSSPSGWLRLAHSLACPFRADARHLRRGQRASGCRFGGLGGAATSSARPVGARVRAHAVLGSAGSLLHSRRLVPSRPVFGRVRG